MDAGDLGAVGSLQKGDFLFEGDVGKILLENLKVVIREVESRSEERIGEGDRTRSGGNGEKK